MRKSRSEHFSTAVPQKADFVLTAMNGSFVPKAGEQIPGNAINSRVSIWRPEIRPRHSPWNAIVLDGSPFSARLSF
jgi:hypothetical protein